MNMHTPGVGPANQMQINARAHGADIDFVFFRSNPHREFRVRRALQFECEMPWLEYILVRCRRDDKSLYLDVRETHFDGLAIDTDDFLSVAWIMRESGQMVI